MVSLFSPRRHSAVGSVTHSAYVAVLSLLLLAVLVGCDSTQLDSPIDTTQPSLTLQLSTSLLELAEGDAARLEVLQNGGASQIVLRNKVSWSTADPTIAAVDGSGMVLAKSAGETTVQAKTTVGTASARVRVGKGGNKLVSISPRASTLNAVGDTVRLAATVAGGGGSVVQNPSIAWSSLDPAIAAVSAHGTVTAEAPGVARITATAAQGADTVSVAVGSAAAAQIITVSVTPSTITVVSGDSVRMAATAKDGKGALLGGTAFTWSSSNNTVATVSASGVVKSLAEGSATITATVAGTNISSAEWGSSGPAAAMGGGKSGSGQIKVNGKSENKVSVSPEADTLIIIGDTTQLTATVLDSQGNVVSDASVTWTSLNTGVATVDTKGIVISTGVGLALITAAYGSAVDTASIQSLSTASEPVVASVSVTPSSASVEVGNAVQLAAVAKDGSGNMLSGLTFTWTSSNTAVAIVSTSGLVSGAAAGSVRITAVAGDKIGAAEITVTSTPSGISGFFVSPTGSDANAGTEGAPWRTVGYALTRLEPGQTLYVRGGTYVENIKSPRIRPGRPDTRIRVAAYPGERPIIQGLLWLTGASYWTLDGINVTWNLANLSTEHMVRMINGVGWVIENSEFWGARSFAGLLVSYNSTGEANQEPRDWTVRNNCIHDTHPSNNTNQDHNIYANSGMHSSGGLIERNVLFNATNGMGVKVGGPASGSGGSGGLTIRNNTIYNSGQNILVNWQSSNTQIERNILVKVGTNYSNIRGYQLSGTNNVARDNLGYAAKSMFLNDDSYSGVTDGGGNVIPVDPKFDAIGCSGFRPQNPAAQAYGHYAPK